MKLRIQGNSLRLRLTQPEVQLIGELETGQESMEVGSGSPDFTYSLYVHTENQSVQVQHQSHGIRVSISAELAQNWASTDQVGIEEHITLGNDKELQVLIEKDFRCLHRNNKEEPHQFPNPAAS